MSEQPFIHLYRSPRGYYFYDVNKDTIVSISKEIYAYLDHKIKYGDLKGEDQKYVDELKDKGYLSDKHFLEIRHPELDNLEYLINNKCSQLILQVTQACNLTCYYCPYANKSNGVLQRDHTNKMMSWDIAKSCIDFFYEHCKESEEVTISFYGGEPLIAFDLIKKAVEYAEDLFLGKQLSFGMTTNATLFNDKMIDFVAEHKFVVLFSIDGPEKIHDINRKKIDGKGSFKEAFRNMCKVIKRYDKDNSSFLRINMVLNPENDVDEIISLFDEEIFKQYRIEVSSSPADDEFLEKEIKATESYRCKMTYQYFLALLDMMNLVENLEIPPFIKAYSQELTKKYAHYKKPGLGLPDVGAPGGPCIPGQRKLFADTEGKFYPCERVSEVSDVMKIGSVLEGIDLEKAANILDVASITSEKCKNCYAILHCTACAKSADAGDHFSAEQRLAHCIETYMAFNDEIQECILLKESRTIYKRRG